VTEEKNQQNGAAISGNTEKAVWSQVISWAAGQPFNNLLLAAIFGGLAWGAHYCITIAVPAHLQMIQKGYETLDKAHQDERHEMRSMYDKWFDRVAKSPSHAAAYGPEQPTIGTN
jgi:hypothetical protein